MPGPFTPSPQIGAIDPAMPDGDALNASVWRELLNNRRHLRGSTWGVLTWSGLLRVSGTAAAPVVIVGAIEAITLTDALMLADEPSATWRPYFTVGETTLGASHVEGGGSLAPSTIYYLYAWSDATAPSTLKFQLSTVPPTDAGAPTARLQYKRLHTSNFRYLGWFPTDASGNPIPCRSIHGRLYFLASAFDHATGIGAGTNPLRVLDEGTATSYADVSLAALMPPHARIAWLRAKVHDASAGDNSVTFRTKGQSFAAFEGAIPASTTVFFGAFPIETDSNRVIQYDLGASGTASLFALGIEE